MSRRILYLLLAFGLPTLIVCSYFVKTGNTARHDHLGQLSSTNKLNLPELEMKDIGIDYNDISKNSLNKSIPGNKYPTLSIVEAPSLEPSTPQNELPCDSLQESSLMGRGLPNIPPTLTPQFDYFNSSDDELTERANMGDGYAQQVYGTRLQDRLLSKAPLVDFGNVKQRSSWEKEFDLMREMFISAIKNRSIASADSLGQTLLFGTPKQDYIDGIAWLIIEGKMGGNALQKLQQNAEFTEEQIELGEHLADVYIDQFDLHSVVKEKNTFMIKDDAHNENTDDRCAN